jgi:hypothetical protein
MAKGKHKRIKGLHYIPAYQITTHIQHAVFKDNNVASIAVCSGIKDKVI